MKKNKIIILAICIVLIALGFTIGNSIYQNKIKPVKIVCEYKTGAVDLDGYESYSKADILYKGKNPSKIVVETYMYGEPEEKDGVKNESTDRNAFLARYNELSIIAKSIDIDGMDLDVSLDNNLIKSITTIDYSKIKDGGDNGLTSLKNKSKEDTIKYFEENFYSCDIKK